MPGLAWTSEASVTAHGGSAKLMICTLCALGDFFRLFRLRLFISSELQYMSALVPGIAEERREISRHNNEGEPDFSVYEGGRVRQHAALYFLHRSTVECLNLIGQKHSGFILMHYI